GGGLGAHRDRGCGGGDTAEGARHGGPLTAQALPETPHDRPAGRDEHAPVVGRWALDGDDLARQSGEPAHDGVPGAFQAFPQAVDDVLTGLHQPVPGAGEGPEDLVLEADDPVDDGADPVGDGGEEGVPGLLREVLDAVPDVQPHVVQEGPDVGDDRDHRVERARDDGLDGLPDPRDDVLDALPDHAPVALEDAADDLEDPDD